MTIKRALIYSSALLMIATITLIISLLVVDKSNKAIGESRRIRHISLLLAEELRESSRGLTAAVQKFTVTGDEKYAKNYMDIVWIRSGKKPRPIDSEIAPGQLISLNELMKQNKYTEQELNLLQQAENFSDDLVFLEVKAMNAARGLFPDENGNYTIIGQPDKNLAMSLIFSNNYENEVSIIMEPFDLFNKELNTRLDQAVDAAQADYRRSMGTVWVVLSVVVVMFVAFLLLVSLLIVRPILLCDMFAKQVTSGNLDSVLNYESDNEIGSLAASLRSMLQSLLERIKLKEHARYFDAVIASADAGVIVMDKYGLITDWNKGAEAILGYRAAEMIGKPRKYYTPENSYDAVHNMETNLISGKSTVRVDVVRTHKNGQLIDCSASYTPIFDDVGNYNGSVSIFHDISDKKQMEAALKAAVAIAEERNQTIIASIDYASKIQKSLLPKQTQFEKAFSDYSIIWQPRDIVSGDIYWLKNFDEGTVLCVCDCTGHGTPGALLTVLVVSALETEVNENNYKDTAAIIWQIEQRLVSVFNVNKPGQAEKENEFMNIKNGCDLVVLFIAKDGSVAISSGNMRVFVCDGKNVSQIKGQRLFIGEGKLKSKDDVNVVTVPANPDNKFYIASDGLYDQPGGDPKLPFGYQSFKQIILDNHSQSQEVITKKIWEAFESYQGKQIRRDDVELIAFKTA